MTQPDRSDLAAGLVFIAIAAAFAWAALDVRMGTLLRMGPGYFPLVLSVLLAALGALMLLRGARRPAAPAGPGQGQGPSFRVAWRPLLLVCGSALFFALTLTSGTAVAQLAKAAFDRARPDLVDHLDRTMTSSFPSAHATVSMVAYLALALALLRAVERPAFRVYIVATGLALSLIVGISRVYLGVHWPSDVLAGWCLGAAWALSCWLVALRLQRRGQVEKPDEAGR